MRGPRSIVVAIGALLFLMASPAGSAPRAIFSISLVGPQTISGGEPSIAVGPEGFLYVSYPTDDGVFFFRSQDDGKTWKPGPVVDENAGDTTVNVDRSGAVYQSNLRNIQANPGLLQADVYKSFNHGRSWPQKGMVPGADNSSNSPLFVDRQWVDVYQPPGKSTNQARVYLTYHDFVPSQIWVNTSKDGGRTFSEQVDAISSPEAQASSFCNTIPGGLRVAQRGPHAGRVYVAWITADVITNAATGCNYTQLNTFYRVWVAWSDDEGSTWTDQLVYDGGLGHDTSALFADLTLDRLGNPYLAFSVNPVDQWDVYVMASFDGGKTWNGKSDGSGPPIRVTRTKGTHIFPAITAGDPGKVDVTWIETRTVIPTLPYGKAFPGGDPNATWRVFMGQSLNLRAKTPKWTTVPVTGIIHTGDVCTLGLFCAAAGPIGADRTLLDFIDVEADARGKARIAYTDSRGPDEGIYVASQRTGSRIR
jgi:hypothetical protein